MYIFGLLSRRLPTLACQGMSWRPMNISSRIDSYNVAVLSVIRFGQNHRYPIVKKYNHPKQNHRM